MNEKEKKSRLEKLEEYVILCSECGEKHKLKDMNRKPMPLDNY